MEKVESWSIASSAAFGFLIYFLLPHIAFNEAIVIYLFAVFCAVRVVVLIVFSCVAGWPFFAGHDQNSLIRSMFLLLFCMAAIVVFFYLAVDKVVVTNFFDYLGASILSYVLSGIVRVVDDFISSVVVFVRSK